MRGVWVRVYYKPCNGVSFKRVGYMGLAMGEMPKAARDEYFFEQWLVCPECGSDNVQEPNFPKPGNNSYFECKDCGAKGVIVG